MALPALCTSFLPSSIHHRQPSLLLFGNPFFSSSTGTEYVTCTLNIKGQKIARRWANYQPSVWDSDSVLSLGIDCTDDKSMKQVQRLKGEVKGLFKREMNQVARLEFVDAIQRRGLGYHFDGDIKNDLGFIYDDREDAWLLDDLHATSLRFRLLRQHGYGIQQDVFQRFMNKMGTFKESLEKDVKGLLGLYEASFHGLEGENILDKAQDFASKHLKNLKLDEIPTSLARQVLHALDMPIHWRPNRLEARWFMDMYKKQFDTNPFDANSISDAFLDRLNRRKSKQKAKRRSN